MSDFDVLHPSPLAVAATEHYGMENRIDLMREELSEAVAAISHWKRGRAGAYEEVCEELADVLFMAEQLAVFMGEDIARWLEEKRARLAGHAWYRNATKEK